MQLSKHGQARMVRPGFLECRKLLFREATALRDSLDHQAGLIKPVLHELRGELYCIPFRWHPCQGGLFLCCQHRLECVPELMEQRVKLRKTQEGLLALFRRPQAGDDGRDWPSVPCFIISLQTPLPGSTTLLSGSRKEVQVQVCGVVLTSLLGKLEKPHVLVPHRPLSFFQLHAEHRLSKLEEALEALVHWEVRPQLLLFDAEEVFLLQTAPVAHVPVPKLALVPLGLRKLLQGQEIRLRVRPRGVQQILKQLPGCLQRGHAALHRKLRVVRHAE
mmetsp:Transcript_100688/g.285332  ORF Transcript_100688/g.285332 Transcript_100688/m.285332 type:complete len:275 (+) Transcript_100688:505-1329(+)